MRAVAAADFALEEQTDAAMTLVDRILQEPSSIAATGCHSRLCRQADDQATTQRSVANGSSWPERAKAEAKLAAVNQSFAAGQQGKF